jgi:hypothetical protein
MMMMMMMMIMMMMMMMMMMMTMMMMIATSPRLPWDSNRRLHDLRTTLLTTERPGQREKYYIDQSGHLVQTRFHQEFIKLTLQ